MGKYGSCKGSTGQLSVDFGSIWKCLDMELMDFTTEIDKHYKSKQLLQLMKQRTRLECINFGCGKHFLCNVYVVLSSGAQVWVEE